MAVDYADKGKPNKRKPAKKPGKKPAAKRPASGARRNRPEPSRPPLMLLAVAVGIVALFIVFLWLLKNNSDDNDTVVTPQAQQTVPQDALPEAPQERWQYFHELETREVEVVVPERAESRRRLMQCGSFRRQGDAESLRAQIALQGMESQIRRSESAEHGIWFRVILGPFDSLREAQSANNQLRRGNIHGCQIWLWNLD